MFSSPAVNFRRIGLLFCLLPLLSGCPTILYQTMYTGKPIDQVIAQLGNDYNVQEGVIQNGRLKGQYGRVYTWEEIAGRVPRTQNLGVSNRTAYYRSGVEERVISRHFYTDRQGIVRDYRENARNNYYWQ